MVDTKASKFLVKMFCPPPYLLFLESSLILQVLISLSKFQLREGINSDHRLKQLLDVSSIILDTFILRFQMETE